jgi:hypothetical protein
MSQQKFNILLDYEQGKDKSQDLPRARHLSMHGLACIRFAS